MLARRRHLELAAARQGVENRLADVQRLLVEPQLYERGHLSDVRAQCLQVHSEDEVPAVGLVRETEVLVELAVQMVRAGADVVRARCGGRRVRDTRQLGAGLRETQRAAGIFTEQVVGEVEKPVHAPGVEQTPGAKKRRLLLPRRQGEQLVYQI